MLHHHRAALRYDLARLHVPLEAIDDGGVSWNAAWEYVSEILRDPSSHLRSAMAGDLYVPDASERAQWAVFELWLNTQLRRGSGYKKIKRPWAGTKPNYRAGTKTAVLDAASVERRKKLEALF